MNPPVSPSSTLKNRLRCGSCILAAGLVLFATRGRGQENDAGLWTNFTLEKKITREFSIVVTEELRFRENITELGTFYTDVGAEYKIWKGLRAAADFRYINKRNPDGTYRQSFRYYGDLSYRQKVHRFTAGYRIRLEVQYAQPGHSELGGVPEWYIRQKLFFDYNTKSRFDPYLSGEIWYKANEPATGFDQYRIQAGAQIRITKVQSLDLGYIFQQEFNVPDPRTDYIIYIGYKVSL
jgi:hypothetical protein